MSSAESGEMSGGECWERLRSAIVGRIAYLDDHTGLEIFPVNFVVDHGTIVLRTAEGRKLTALAERPLVVFEADGGDQVLLTWNEGELFYSVAGDLTPEQALAIAESLQ